MLRRWPLSFFTLLALILAACASETPPPGAAGPNQGGSQLGGASTATAEPAVRSARISELRNTVNSKKTNVAEWLTASEGEQILAGGGVRTGAESRVRIDTSDESLIRIGANTEFQLLEFSPQLTDPVTRLQLDAGKLWVQVTQALGGGSFEVETPAGVAAVRGSLMSVAFDRAAGRMAVTCLEGECELRDRAQNAVRLQAGEASEIAGPGQGPLAARRINRAELQDWIDNFPEAVAIARSWLESLGLDKTGLTACDHPYWPMRPGATWIYTTSEGPVTWTIESVSGDASQAVAVMTFTTGKITGTYNWQCDQNGITSFDFGQLTLTEFGTISDFVVTSSSGVWLPPADRLTVGYAWALTFDFQMNFAGSVGSDAGVTTATASVTENNTVSGANPVSFDGQAFDGLQITRESFRNIQMQMAGVTVPPIQLNDTGNWEMARGIGAVRWTSTAGDTRTTGELVSYSIP